MQTEKRMCVICGKEFEKYAKKNNRSRRRTIRSSKAVTCSSKCSKIHSRECRYVQVSNE